MSSSAKKISVFSLIVIILLVLPHHHGLLAQHGTFGNDLNRLFWLRNYLFSSVSLVQFPGLLMLGLQDNPNISQKDTLLTKQTNDTTRSETDKPSIFNYEDTPLLKTEQPPLLNVPSMRREPVQRYKFGYANDPKPKGFQSESNVDSLGRSVISREIYDSIDIAYPYDIGLDDYLMMRQANIRHGIWDSLVTGYDLKKALSGGDIARLIGQATGIAIPIPPNPLMSIFGKPEISINVSGEVNIRMGFRWDSQNLGTVSAFGQTQATPMFSQDIRVNVSGKIGDKFSLGTDWNTSRNFDYQNKFKIGYDGYDDDIIKLVEVGNVSLPLQTSLISGGEALFGVRADFQFGPLYLKTLFSQRRGETKMVNVQGGSSKQPFLLRAYDYARNHFFLDTAYKKVYKDYFANSTPIIPPSASTLRVKEIEVWETTNNLTDVQSAEAVAFADLKPLQLRRKPVPDKYPDSLKVATITAGIVERGRFLRLDSTRYKINYNLGTLTINNLRQDRTYAVAYRVEGATAIPEDDEYYGTLSSNSNTKDTLILKLISRPNMQPEFRLLWNRQMKNVYSINATQVNPQDTKIGIWYINQNNDSTDVLEGAPDKLVTIMKVDQVNNSTGAPPPDAQFDLQMPFFDAYNGEITFPDPEPFRGAFIDYFTKIGNPDLAQNYIYNEVYDTTYDVARRNTAKDRFVISGEVSGRLSNRISLGAFNIVQNSVKVTLNGRQLREYEDYIVDYYAGTLTMRNAAASLPNADLKIEVEQHDVFNISTRTLAGIRGDYTFLKTRKADVMLGFTGMLYDQAAIVDRVRIGDEPVSNIMFGIDGKLNWDTPWLTNLLDALPFYDTKAPSSIALKGEMAMILPEPNKRTSEIASDGGQPVVYIDDFEGAQRYISLGLNPTQWQHSSAPLDDDIAPNDSLRALFRGKAFWWQFFIPRVNIKEVYPNRSVMTGHSNLSPLEIRFAPEIRGIYNKNPEYLDTLNPNYDPNNDFSKKFENRRRIWGGMMRLFSSFTTNFDTENIEYIEIMMRILPPFEGAGNTRMFIDMGQISEDIIPNLILDTEDGSGTNPIPNNIIDVGEDKGIDKLFDDDEKNNYPFPLNLEKDPARDDYSFDFGKDDQIRNGDGGDFVSYNNFEGNSLVSEVGQFPDTEILNKNNGQTLSLDNSYFSYEVNLDTDPNRNRQIVGGGNAGWYLWRIPIRKPTSKVGNPLFSNIQYIRVWFKGGPIHAQIADWRLVGSQWQRISNFQSNVAADDSVMQIAFVNREENSGPPDYYTPPPGVEPPKMIGNNDQTQVFYLNEQSLSLSVKNLRYADERMAVRIFRPVDIFSYKKMKFFLHGDGSMTDNIVPGATPKAEAFLRFGTDSANYYEYRKPLIRGWQEVEIELSDITAIKERRDSTRIFERQVFRAPKDSMALFIIKGNPILTKVQFFGAGITNPAQRFPNELTTTMWLNELRLIDPERSADWGAITNLDVKLADLGSINANFTHTEPNFHKLEERFGNRISTSNWTVSMQAGLEKFAPKSFKNMKIPISYTHSEYSQNPEYVANNDINLERAAAAKRQEYIDRNKTPQEADNAANEVRMRSQTLRVQDSWALTGVQLGLPTDYWLIRETFNRLTIGYSYSQEYERSPVVAEKFRWLWKLDSKYALSLPKLLELSPLTWAKSVPVLETYAGWKINFLPSNFSAALNMSRGRTTEQSRFLQVPSPVFRDFSAARQAQFSWKFTEGGFINPSLDYSVTSNSTLVKLEFDEQGRQLTGSQIASRLFFKNGAIFNFGDNNLHSQVFTLNIAPKLPNIGGVNNYIDMSGSFNTTYNWQNPLQPDSTIRDVAKVASYNNSIRFGTSLKLKSAADKWFGVIDQRNAPTKVPGDTIPGNFLGAIGKIFKTIFLDYDKIQIDFTQQNQSQNPGVYGGTGMNNFWGRGVLGRSDNQIYGPSFPYQLGLVTDPHGGFQMHSSNSFPYFGFSTFTGLRPPNAVMQDNFNQQTTLQVSTNRPLWEGAVLDLRWQTNFAYNKNQTVLTDKDGVPTFTNVIALESFTRSYLAIPPIFGLNLAGTIEDVVNMYNQKAAVIDNSNMDDIQKNREKQSALTESFHDALQAFTMFKGKANKFMPAINWGIRWEGIEKWGIWSGLVKRATIEHTYQSQYQESAQLTDNGRVVLSQQVQYGFQPLVALNLGFDEKKLNGNLTASLRYNTNTQFQLMTSNRSTISRNAVEELTLQASYTLRGWEFPLLGFNFKNDIEFSFLGSYKSNKRNTYDILDTASYQGKENQGRNLEGNKQITLEPRARYSISNRLTASFFIRYEGTFTEGAAQPGFSTTQVGLDLRLSISGGR